MRFLVRNVYHLFADKFCDLPHIENGKIAPYYYNFKGYYFPMRKDKKLSYSCVAGYTTETGTQEGRITCTAKGWSPVPRCYIRRTYHNGDKVRIQCQSKFEIRGYEEIQCENGKWTSPPICIGYCTSPPVIKNSVLLSPLLLSYKNGSSVEYGCQLYHFLDGPSTVYCKEGNWTEQPTCLDPCVLNATALNNNNLELKWRQEELTFLHGDLIEFECKEGYDFPQTTLPSPGRTQCNNGRLKYPKCVVKGKAIFC
uniref:Sushi domain-containing protein n=1 Tax=Cairina moschata TaxID=8855 RepID=A0A8C3CFL0_CAIMO